MHRHRFTPEQIVQIYTDANAGLTHKQIAEKLHAPYVSIISAQRHLDKYLTGKYKRQKKTSDSYLNALRMIRKERRLLKQQTLVSSIAPATGTPEDHLSLLKASFDQFQSAIALYIKSETQTRQKSLQEELKAVKEENEKLRQKIEELRTPNWIESLAVKEEHE